LILRTIQQQFWRENFYESESIYHAANFLAETYEARAEMYKANVERDRQRVEHHKAIVARLVNYLSEKCTELAQAQARAQRLDLDTDAGNPREELLTENGVSHC
jgi:hypothetical protein